MAVSDRLTGSGLLPRLPACRVPATVTALAHLVVDAPTTWQRCGCSRAFGEHVLRLRAELQNLPSTLYLGCVRGTVLRSVQVPGATGGLCMQSSLIRSSARLATLTLLLV